MYPIPKLFAKTILDFLHRLAKAKFTAKNYSGIDVAPGIFGKNIKHSP